MPAPVAERTWTATPRQREFLLATEDEVLYGGAAGGGKTDALLILAALRCSQVPGAHVLYLRREFSDLELSAIPRALELFTGTGPRYNAGKYRWTWPNGSRLQFGHIETEADVYGYQSAEFGLVLFDELTEFSEGMYLFLLGRNRTTRPGERALMRAATNPGNAGHAWVMDRFVKATRHGQDVYENPETGRTRRFVPAKLDDNPHLALADPGYVQRLSELPPARRAAMRDGSWEQAEGLAFGEWRERLPYVCRPFAIPAWWRRWRSNDPGYGDPFAWYWFAAAPDGRVFAYREFARAKDAQRLIYSDQAAIVTGLSMLGGEVGDVERDPQTKREIRERIEYTAVGWDAFRQHPETGRSIVDYYDDGGVTGVVEAPRDKAARYGAVLEALRIRRWPKSDLEPIAGVVGPQLVVFSTCKLLIEALPKLMTDPRKPDQVGDSAWDHYYDALGYGLQSWHPDDSEPPSPALSAIQRHKQKLVKGRKRLL